MSTAFYPTNMRQQPAGGFNHGSVIQNIPYRPWKGTGIFSNPIGVTATNIRPLTNLDPGNVFPTGFGLARPIKHYRKGTVIPIHFKVLSMDPQNPSATVETSLIEYNVNRAVKSSYGTSLGGGNGGTNLITQTQSFPGGYSIKDNQPVNDNPYVGLDNFSFEPTNNIPKDCRNCNGQALVSNWAPISNLTEQPEPNVDNPILCCNQQRKAIQRVLPASTLVKKNYYQDTYMYLYNRCQTFQQRQFNFISGKVDPKLLEIIKTYPFISAKILEYSKPGDPTSNFNLYVAQCNPNFTIEIGAELAFIDSLAETLLNGNYITVENYNFLLNRQNLSIYTFIDRLKEILNKDTFGLVIAYLYEISANPYAPSLISGPSNPKGCSRVFYKPNNPQFAKQGGVQSSTRTLKLTVDTISTAAAKNRRLKGANAAVSLAYGEKPYTPFIYKDKTNILCAPQEYSGAPFFFSGQHQNHKICSQDKNVYQKVSQYQRNGGLYTHSAGNYIGATQIAGQRY